MGKTTVAVSKDLLKELLREKSRLKSRTIEETIRIILADYRKLRRKEALAKIIEKNREERKVDVEELLEDRRKWGKARKFS